MTNDKEQLTAWLNDAHSMEMSLIQVLENHANDAKEFPEIRERISRHLEETRRHARDVEECLNLLGEKPSATKSMTGNLMGKVHAVSTGMYKDEIVKNFLADYASENFEIACYTSLIAAADELGYAQIVALCERILEDERSMGNWLLEQIPSVTRIFLNEKVAAN